MSDHNFGPDHELRRARFPSQQHKDVIEWLNIVKSGGGSVGSPEANSIAATFEAALRRAETDDGDITSRQSEREQLELTEDQAKDMKIEILEEMVICRDDILKSTVERYERQLKNRDAYFDTMIKRQEEHTRSIVDAKQAQAEQLLTDLSKDRQEIHAAYSRAAEALVWMGMRPDQTLHMLKTGQIKVPSPSNSTPDASMVSAYPEAVRLGHRAFAPRFLAPIVDPSITHGTRNVAYDQGRSLPSLASLDIDPFARSNFELANKLYRPNFRAPEPWPIGSTEKQHPLSSPGATPNPAMIDTGGYKYQPLNANTTMPGQFAQRQPPPPASQYPALEPLPTGPTSLLVHRLTTESYSAYNPSGSQAVHNSTNWRVSSDPRAHITRTGERRSHDEAFGSDNDQDSQDDKPVNEGPKKVVFRH